MTAHKSISRKALYLSVTLEKLKQPIIGAFHRPHFCSGLLGHHKQDSPGGAECKLLKETIREIAPMSKVLDIYSHRMENRKSSIIEKERRIK